MNRQYPMATIHSTSVEDFDAGDSDILLGRTEETSYPWQRWYREHHSKKRKRLYIVGAVLVVLFLSGIMYKMGAHMAAVKKPEMSSVPEERISDRLTALNGSPTLKFRGLNLCFQLFCESSANSIFLADNLKPNLRYITSWIDAGWSTLFLILLVPRD
jgi:hypothetical protein